MKKANSLLDMALVSNGKHSVKIKLWSQNTEKNRIEIEFRDTEDVEIKVNLYAGYIPTFMQAINRQTKGNAGLKLSDMLNYCKSNPIDIWTYYDDYGLKASYFPPKA